MIGSSAGLPHFFGGRLFCGRVKSRLFAFDTQSEIVRDARCRLSRRPAAGAGACASWCRRRTIPAALRSLGSPAAVRGLRPGRRAAAAPGAGRLLERGCSCRTMIPSGASPSPVRLVPIPVCQCVPIRVLRRDGPGRLDSLVRLPLTHWVRPSFRGGRLLPRRVIEDRLQVLRFSRRQSAAVRQPVRRAAQRALRRTERTTVEIRTADVQTVEVREPSERRIPAVWLHRARRVLCRIRDQTGLRQVAPRGRPDYRYSRGSWNCSYREASRFPIHLQEEHNGRDYRADPTATVFSSRSVR